MSRSPAPQCPHGGVFAALTEQQQQGRSDHAARHNVECPPTAHSELAAPTRDRDTVRADAHIDALSRARRATVPVALMALVLVALVTSLAPSSTALIVVSLVVALIAFYRWRAWSRAVHLAALRHRRDRSP